MFYSFFRFLTIIGLFLTSIGSGCILPCVSSFGGDQFVMPKEEDQLRKFFSIFYFSVNAGSFLSSFITPELRKSVQCFGKDSCFPLAFGVPALFTFTSIGTYLNNSRAGPIHFQICTFLCQYLAYNMH